MYTVVNRTLTVRLNIRDARVPAVVQLYLHAPLSRLLTVKYQSNRKIRKLQVYIVIRLKLMSEGGPATRILTIKSIFDPKHDIKFEISHVFVIIESYAVTRARCLF